MAQQIGDGSVAASGGLVTASGLLRRAKLELGLILLLAGVVWLLAGRLFDNTLAQLAVLGSYGAAGMLWLLRRARQALACLERE